MKTITTLAICVLLGMSSVATATDFGFNVSGLQSQVQRLNTRVQAAQQQQQAKLARQIQFVQQQQLAAANAVNVHAQLAQLRAHQQAQALEAVHLSNSFDFQQQLVVPQVHYQAPAQAIVRQPVVVQQQVVKQPVRQFQRVQRVRQLHCR